LVKATLDSTWLKGIPFRIGEKHTGSAWLKGDGFRINKRHTQFKIGEKALRKALVLAL